MLKHLFFLARPRKSLTILHNFQILTYEHKVRKVLFNIQGIDGGA